MVLSAVKKLLVDARADGEARLQGQDGRLLRAANELRPQLCIVRLDGQACAEIGQQRSDKAGSVCDE